MGGGRALGNVNMFRSGTGLLWGLRKLRALSSWEADEGGATICDQDWTIPMSFGLGLGCSAN